MSKKCQDFIGSVRLSGNSWKQKIDNNFIYIFYVHFTKEFSKSAAVKPRIQWIYFFLALICIFMTFEMCSLLLRKCSIYDGIKFDKKCEKKRKWKKKVKRKHSSTFSLFSKWVSVTSVTLWGQILFEHVFYFFFYKIWSMKCFSEHFSAFERWNLLQSFPWEYWKYVKIREFGPTVK